MLPLPTPFMGAAKIIEVSLFVTRHPVDGKGVWTRPLSVSFQFRASGKETDMATPLGLEKYGRIDFSLGKLTI